MADKKKTKAKAKIKSKLGFETSGHYSFYHAMDGIYASGLVLEIIKEKPELIDKILNIPITYKLKIYNFPANQNKIIKLKLHQIKNKEAKIIVRNSIWENLIRIYLFYKKVIQ